MSSYVPLAVKTHYSLCKAINQPGQLKAHSEKLGLERMAITDTNNISGSLAVRKEMPNTIIGATIELWGEGSIILLAKNLAGWKDLIKITAAAQMTAPEKEIMGMLTDNLILLTYTYPYKWLHQEDYEQDFGDWWDSIPIRDKYVTVTFGGWHPKGFQEKLRNLDLKTVALPDSYYCTEEQHEDLQILLCVDTKQKLDEARNNGGYFFDYCCYHIPSYDECLQLGWNERELQNTKAIAESCEDYELRNDPMLPKMADDSDALLRQYCREGWRRKIDGYVPKEQHEEYTARIKTELDIFKQAELADYFLLVREIEKWAKDQGWFVGPSRGSAGGCLVSYLIDITEMDPIPHGLMFERFYSAARKGSLPDIDCDFPVHSREAIIGFIKERFGHNNVCHIATYQTLKGRAALTSVLSAHGFEFSAIKRITDKIVPDHKVSDKMNDEGEESLIRFCLRHYAKDFMGSCQLEEDGTLSGQDAPYFAQAIRLEGTKRALSQHAAGIIVSPVPILDVAPMWLNKHNEFILGVEMEEAEQLGLLKMDVLGVAALDKVQAAVQRIARDGALMAL